MNGNPDQRHRYLGAARLVTLVALAAMLAGCGRGGSSCNDQDVWCAGLVTDFGSVDQGINEQAWLAMEDARASGILDRIDRIETVDSRDRSANIAAFAQLHNKTQSSASQTIGSLERRGLVTKVPGSDRRMRILELTETGRKALKHDPIHRLARTIEELPDAELQRLARALGRILRQTDR